jgi:hypothetical protein
MKLAGGKAKAIKFPASPHGGSCFEIVEEHEELNGDRLSDNDFYPSPRSVLGVNSSNYYDFPDESLFNPIKIFQGLREYEDLIPRAKQKIIEPYDKEESSSQGSSKMYQEWRVYKAAKRLEA